MNNKKIIFIILGLALLAFLFIYGLKIYDQSNNNHVLHDEKINEIMSSAQLESESCLTKDLDSEYRICCAITGGIKKGLFYDCTSQQYFESNQLVRIIFDPSGLDFNYNPYYLNIYSDLYNEEDNIIQEELVEAIEKEESSKFIISGKVPQDKGLFTLLNLRVYSNTSSFEESDEKIILNLQAQMIKEN
jgi:hypothetical protein